MVNSAEGHQGGGGAIEHNHDILVLLIVDPLNHGSGATEHANLGLKLRFAGENPETTCLILFATIRERKYAHCRGK